VNGIIVVMGYIGTAGRNYMKKVTGDDSKDG